MPCNPEDLAQVELFELLDAGELREFAAVVDVEQLAAGETLFHIGEPGEVLYIVKQGEIELFLKDTVGQKIILKICGTGEMFGELSLFDHRPRSATALAITDTEVFVIDRGDLLLLFQKKPDAGLNMLGSLSRMLREADDLLRKRVSKNVNEEIEEKLTPIQRVSDWIAWFSGSMEFLVLNGIWFVLWTGLNVFGPEEWRFDPFPFGLLTMLTGLEAIFLACFVLVSQNRQAEKDRVRSDIEYEVNIKAEMEVAHLHEKIDHVQEQMLARLDRIEKKS
jgi:uncharacterized membrane protein